MGRKIARGQTLVLASHNTGKLREIEALVRPLGIAVVGGLLVAQLFTLYTTPTVYLLMDGLVRRARRRALGPQAVAAE